MASAREQNKKRMRHLFQRASKEAEPAIVTLPTLDSFAFTSSSNPSTYTEERLETAEEKGLEANKQKPELPKAHTEFLPSSRHETDNIEYGGDKEHAEDGSKLGAVIPGACDALVDVAHALVADLEGLTFRAPVSCVYNPLLYAQDLHEQYIRRHGGRRIEVLLVGMNPGPFGMAQTGVPFGDSSFVRAFHGLSGKVDSPEIPHPKRPVHGLECKRSEISGQRLWGWAQDRFGNRTPDKLHPSERAKLEIACNRALIKAVSILRPVFVIGVGKYATTKIQQCKITGVKVGDIMHPSPANPHANKDWGKKIEAQLLELGVALPK